MVIPFMSFAVFDVALLCVCVCACREEDPLCRYIVKDEALHRHEDEMRALQLKREEELEKLCLQMQQEEEAFRRRWAEKEALRRHEDEMRSVQRNRDELKEKFRVEFQRQISRNNKLSLQPAKMSSLREDSLIVISDSQKEDQSGGISVRVSSKYPLNLV